MVWGRKQIEQHKKAAKILNKIKNSSFNFIKKNEDVTEYDVQQFILEKFEKWGLKNEDYDYLKNTIQRLSLPELPNFDYKEILNIMDNDKKIQSGNLYFILLEDIGHAVIQNNINDKKY